VGIGTSSPDTLLEVVGADPILTIRDTETSGASSNATLRLAESGASDTLNNYWDINHTGGSALRFVSKIGATTAERMRIDSSGNLLVGKTGASVSTAGAELRADGQISSTRSGDTPVFINRLTNDGKLIDFRKDGTTVGSIGTLSSRMYMGTGDTGLFFNDQTDQIQPWNTATNSARDAAIDLGRTDRRFKDLYLSGSVKTGSGLDLTDGTSIFGSIAVSSSSLALNARNTGVMLFQSGGAEKARIDAAGNLLVGTTDSAPGAGDTNTGVSFRAGGDAFFSKASSYAARFNRNTNDGDVVTFAKDGTNVGSIGIEAAGFTIDGETGHTGLQFGSSAIIPRDNGSNTDGANDLGASVHRFKDLYLSGASRSGGMEVSGAPPLSFGASKLMVQQEAANITRLYTCGPDASTYGELLMYTAKSNGTPIESLRIQSNASVYLPSGLNLGGTGAANKLDDYESGTWTPIFADASTGGNVASVGARLGSYTKVGNLVTVGCGLNDINISGLTSSNAIYIRGLPFVTGTTQIRSGCAFLDRVTFSGYVTAYATGSHVLLFNTATGAHDAALLVSSIDTSGSDVFFTLQYQV
jgi:hypothetical protein